MLDDFTIRDYESDDYKQAWELHESCAYHVHPRNTFDAAIHEFKAGVCECRANVLIGFILYDFEVNSLRLFELTLDPFADYQDSGIANACIAWLQHKLVAPLMPKQIVCDCHAHDHATIQILRDAAFSVSRVNEAYNSITMIYRKPRKHQRRKRQPMTFDQRATWRAPV